MSVTELRRFTIGGSDAAAACGIDPHKSAIMLWAEKTGRVERPTTEAMRWGTRLEPLIVDAVMELGYFHERPVQDDYTDPERKWLRGMPDGFTGTDPANPERWIFEAKTMGQWAHARDGGAPLHYVAQVHHYLHLTGLEHALLAVLVGGQRLELHEIEREDSAIDILLELEEKFYNCLRTDTPPAPDDSQSARDALLELFPGASEGTTVRLDREHWRLVRELRARKEQAATIERQVTELENRLKLFMGDAERAISPHDEEAIRWSNVQSKRVDTKALRELRPEIAAEYESVTKTRRFVLL